MDVKDNKILELLKKNSKLSTQQISKATLIPITTVHHRIKKLEEEGIIKGYSVVLDNKKLGKPLSAYMLVKVDYKRLKELKTTQHELAKKLKQHSFVEEVSMVTGDTDIIMRIRVASIDEMNEFVTTYLRNVEGIERTQTVVILNEF